MKTNKEQEKNVTNAAAEDLVTFECKTDLQPKVVYSKGMTGYKFDYDFSWVRDPNVLLDATKDDKNYVPVNSETVNPYDEVIDELHKAAEMCQKAELTDIYNDVFRCIVAKLDKEVAKASAKVASTGLESDLFRCIEYAKGQELEAKTIRDYVQRLFNDSSFRYRELYELLGDK